MPTRETTRSRLRGIARRLPTRSGRTVARPPGPWPALPRTARPSPVGRVEEFTRRTVHGWIVVPAGSDPIRVDLYLNSLRVASTWLTQPDPAQPVPDTGESRDEVRRFRFTLADVWGFARKNGRFSVRIGTHPLPIDGHGTHLNPPANGRRHMHELLELFDKHYVFSRSGHLQLSKKYDTEWQERVLGLYAGVREALRDAFGYDPFLIYGTLLGAVREDGFIGHDDDFDTAYLSKNTDPAAAARELQEIAIALIDRGYDVETRTTALHIHDREDPATRIDLFHIYFDADGTLQFPFGVAGSSTFVREQWTGIHDIEFAGATVAVPAAAETLVEHIYGPGWRQPNPGFVWDHERTAFDRAGRLGVQLRQPAYWSNFYANNTTESRPSTFAERVRACWDTAAISGAGAAIPLVFDIGCGDGRDARYFAANGSDVVGLDRSATGIRGAGATAAAAGLGERVRFRGCDAGDAGDVRAELGEALLRHPDEPALFYLRFFLHSIPEGVQRTLLTTIAELARPGDLFAAEFRTDKDENTRKVHGGHYRRFQNAADFRAQLVGEYGFSTVLDEQEGTGLSPYRGEDPELYRIIARRAAAQ